MCKRQLISGGPVAFKGLFVALLLIACSPTPSPKASNSVFQKQCRQEIIALGEQQNRDARQLAYERCLQKARATSSVPPTASETPVLPEFNQDETNQEPSPADLYVKCKLQQDDVIRLGKERVRAQAELVQATTSAQTSSPERIKEIEDRLSAIEQDLQERIPEEARMEKRGGLTEADLRKFKTCERADFLGSSS